MKMHVLFYDPAIMKRELKFIPLWGYWRAKPKWSLLIADLVMFSLNSIIAGQSALKTRPSFDDFPARNTGIDRDTPENKPYKGDHTHVGQQTFPFLTGFK